MAVPTIQVLAGFQGVNLNTADGTFETGVTGWVPTNGTFAQSAAQAHTGSNSGLLTVTGTPVTALVRQPQVAVTPNAWYEFTFWVYSDVASVQIAVDWYTSVGGTYISTLAVSYTVTIHTWSQITAGGFAPGTAGAATGGPTLPGSPATGTKLYMDDYFGPITGPGAFMDISAFVNGQLTVTRPSTRVQGPLWEYQAGTCSVVLDNTGGQFDPDNLTGPYVSPGTLTSVILGQDVASWTAPVNLWGATMDARCWAAGRHTSGVAVSDGSGGGEYAEEPMLPVTAGQVFTAQTGQGFSGAANIDTIFGTVHAHGATGAPGGTGSSNTIHHDGGGGGTHSGNFGAGAGGGAGPNMTGNPGMPGNAALDPAPGGLPVTGGGAGGFGGDTTVSATSGATPGGGAGGPGNNTFDSGASGGSGQIQLLWKIASGTNVTQVGPGVPIQILATWSGTTYNLFTGNADAWQETAVDYEGGYSEITLTASDGFEIFTNTTLPAAQPLGMAEDSGARVTRILNNAGWPAAARSITTGDGIQQGATYGSDALSLLQLTTDTETGELYINGAGQVVFRHRRAVITDTRSNTPQAVFGDLPGTSHTAGTELAMATVGRANDNTTLANDIQITAAGSANLQEAQDLSSEYVQQGQRSYARTDLLLPDDPTALQYANWLLTVSKMSEDRFDTITVDPLADTTNLWPQVLGRDIGDRIQVWKRPPNVTAFSKDVLIRSITHTADTAQSPPQWNTTWTLQSAAKYAQFFLLNSAASGVLDTNVLGF